MNITQADHYYLKALNNYPYEINEVSEALAYALSCEEFHAGAHCLMGRLNMEFLKDFEAARHHFEMALVSDAKFTDTYTFYSYFLIKQDDLQKAQLIIQKGMAIDGIDKALLIQRQAMIFEKKGNYLLAKKQMEVAYQFSFNDAYVYYFDREIKRIKDKIKQVKRRQTSDVRRQT